MRFGRKISVRHVVATIGAAVAVCMLAAWSGPAAAEDLRVENYKRTIEGLVSRWAAEEIPLSNKLTAVLKELDEKQKIASPSAADKQRIAELVAQGEDIRKKMDAASNNLQLELMIVEVQPGAPERDLIQLPGWLTGIIKAKGVPVGKHVKLQPHAEFDFKKLKLKSFSAGLEITW